jgi:hypothetical protein
MKPLNLIKNANPNFVTSPRRGMLRLVASHGKILESQLIANPIQAPKITSLDDALQSLGAELFKQALHIWSLIELKSTMENCWSDCPDYEFIYNYRQEKKAS